MRREMIRELRGEVRIPATLLGKSPRDADVVHKAVNVDNQALPRGISIEQTLNCNVLIFKVSLDKKNINSLLRTLDDFLVAVKVARDSLEALRNAGVLGDL